MILQVRQFDFDSQCIRFDSFEVILVIFPFLSGEAVYRVEDIGGEAFSFQVFQSPSAFLHNIVEKGRDFFPVIRQSHHHPKGVKDQGSAVCILLPRMGLYRDLESPL